MQVKRIYEAMFVVDADFAANWGDVEVEINRLMERSEAESLYCKKWDERRLAYEIEKRKRALYVLAFFKAPTEKIVGMERDVQLSEHIIRALIVRTDRYTEEQLRELAAGEGIQPVRIISHYGDERGERGDRRRDDGDFGGGDEGGPRFRPRGPRFDRDREQSAE